jgi:hypothetical protein
MSENKNVSYVWIGNDVWYIHEPLKKQHGKSVTFQEMDIIEYTHLLQNCQSSIMIVPLVKNDFNKAKSNIGFIEGTFAGAMTIAPDLPEFKKCNGCVTYTDNFKYLLEKAVKSRTFREENFIKSINYVKKNHNELSVDMKAWCVVVVKKIHERKKFEYEEDITTTIDDFITYWKTNYGDYCNNLAMFASDFDKDLGFIYKYIHEKIGS